MTHKTKNGVLLQCEVQGSPQPTVEWKDSAGSTLPAGETQVSERDGRSYFTVNTTVTRSDDFRCVATQKEINHTIYTTIYVPPSESTTGWIGIVAVLCTVLFILFVVVVGGVVLAVLVAKGRITLKYNKDSEKRKPLNDSVSQSEQLQPPQTSPVI